LIISFNVVGRYFSTHIKLDKSLFTEGIYARTSEKK
jgi:hypothetical protein